MVFALPSFLDHGPCHLVRTTAFVSQLNQYSLHHYFPALYFGIICFATFIDLVFKRFPPFIHKTVLLTCIISCVSVFWFFKDFAFGFTGPAVNYKDRRWVSTWNFYDIPGEIRYEASPIKEKNE